MGKILTPLLLFATLLTSAVYTTGCNDIGCLDNQSSRPMAAFFDYNNHKQQLSIDSLSFFGVGATHDSLLLDSALKVPALYFPLNNNAKESRFVLQYNIKSNVSHQYNDTIAIFYTHNIYFASAECGCVARYVIDSLTYTRNLLDSVAIMTREVTNKSMQNFHLFYTVAK